MGGEILPD